MFAAPADDERHPSWVAYEPDLVPPLALMREEGITVLEEWFRWAEEWSMLLRIYGRITAASRVLEIGCGLGRVAFPLRYVLSKEGSYTGFDIVRNKIEFLKRNFEPAHPNFHFHWADVHNTYYNPKGRLPAAQYRFPVMDRSMDIVFAASVFTHMLPEHAAHYFRESARVLRPGGRCVFSFFLLDNYRAGQPRPGGFARDIFDFAHRAAGHGDDFAIVQPDNPEQMTAYRLSLVERLAGDTGLRLAEPPAAGLWSGGFPSWVGAQDTVVLTTGDA